jgi:hypothetical protein
MTQPGRQSKDLPRNVSAPHPSDEPSYEEVQRRAYHIYLERGESGGSELENWLLAENELKSSGRQN